MQVMRTRAKKCVCTTPGSRKIDYVDNNPPHPDWSFISRSNNKLIIASPFHLERFCPLSLSLFSNFSLSLLFFE